MGQTISSNNNIHKLKGRGKYPIDLYKIDQIDFLKILTDFTPPPKNNYKLPRIVFIGLFSCLSMTCQRHIAKNLGFEYYDGIKFSSAAPKDLALFATKWTDITKSYTRLIVLGDHTCEVSDNGYLALNPEYETQLYKTYKQDKKSNEARNPVYIENQIPVIMESELVKLHSDYPNINNSTHWGEEPKLANQKIY